MFPVGVVAGKSKWVVVEVWDGLGDGEREREMRLNLACAVRWPELEVELDSDLVIARRGRAAALASARFDEGVGAPSSSSTEGWSSVAKLAKGFPSDM